MGNPKDRLLAVQSAFTYLRPATDAPVDAFCLPDGAHVHIHTPSSLPDSIPETHIRIDDVPTALWRTLSRTATLLLSAVGTPHEPTASHVPAFPVLELSAPPRAQSISISDTWALIYALHILLHEQETIPVVLGSSIRNHAQVAGYLLRSGLARRAQPSAKDADEAVLFLMRATFWQGAGTIGYHTRGWVPPSSPSSSFSDSSAGSGTHASPPFPFVPSFTRTATVIASHPLRPPKPALGEVLYRKWCPGIEPAGAMLEFAHLDLGSSLGEETAHFKAFHKWHNDPRVNKGWNEQGSKEHHRKYLEGLNRDPNVIPMIMSWDGELMGYVEFVWIKENHVAPYVPGGARDYDRGIHVLVGEDKFRGFARTQAWHRALFHYCFLADPRTDRVIGEPRLENPAILKVDLDSAMHFETIFDFPYKRSVLTSQPRERFFRLDLL